MPTTKAVVQGYFDALKRKQDWQSCLADDLQFTSFTSPNKRLAGKSAYLESTKRFFSMVSSVELRTLIADGDTACALTRYELRLPSGAPLQSDVAEIFTVREGRIASFGIYFDSAPFPK
jgi:ketosteroid isomerase-like protein